MVSAGSRPLLSVIIPCFNEAATILDLIERVRQAPVPSKQLIVVDDGSTDGTRELSVSYTHLTLPTICSV